MKQHSCATYDMKTSTQTAIDKVMIIRKTLTGEQSSVFNHIQVVAQSRREPIKELLEEPYKNGCWSLSLDFWCDKYEQISYLGVTAVIIDQGYKYYALDLFCKPF